LTTLLKFSFLALVGRGQLVAYTNFLLPKFGTLSEALLLYILDLRAEELEIMEDVPVFVVWLYWRRRWMMLLSGVCCCCCCCYRCRFLLRRVRVGGEKQTKNAALVSVTKSHNCG
tara:strand:+ start:469 stop:813 length:345 start_codon:yes stop_codon:yes gene_type:complete